MGAVYCSHWEANLCDRFARFGIQKIKIQTSQTEQKEQHSAEPHDKLGPMPKQPQP